MKIWIKGNSSPGKKEDAEVASEKDAVAVGDKEAGPEGPSSPITPQTKNVEGSEGSSKGAKPVEEEEWDDRKPKRKKQRATTNRKRN